MNKLTSIFASAYSATITIIVVTLLTIGAELAPKFKTWLADFTGHHWVTKSWASLIVFILFFLVFRLAKNVTPEQTKKALWTLEIAIILGSLAILGFYMYEFF